MKKNKNFVIKRSAPISRRNLLILIDKESVSVKNLALEVLEKFGNENTQLGIVFKSSIPKSNDGIILSEIRNNLKRISLYLQTLKYQQ